MHGRLDGQIISNLGFIMLDTECLKNHEPSTDSNTIDRGDFESNKELTLQE